MNVFTRKPELWKREIIAHTNESPWAYKGDIVGNTQPKERNSDNLINLNSFTYTTNAGKLNVVSSNPKEVASGTKIFILAGPVFAQQPILEKLAPFVEKESLIGTVFGQGGFDWLASYVFGKRIRKDNLTIWALQNVPSLCKIKAYGQEVRIIGPKLIL